MKPEFFKYNLEQLLEEKSFISWVLNQENNTEWERFVESNPGFRSKAKKAREIIHMLQDRYEVLDENSVLEIWKNIDKYEQQYKQKIRRLKIRRRLSWAASVLLVVSLGTFGYLYLNEKDQGYQFVTSDLQQNSKARMVLSTGEEIALKKDNSTIALNDAASQVTVNDSIVNLSEQTGTGQQTAQMNEVIIPYGKKTELLLADGTKVWLNAGSRLAFPSKFTKNTREIYLEGEACFLVAKNENQPFIVKTGGLDVKVLGTHFNVSAYSKDATIETVLLEGSVAVQKPKAFGLGKTEVVLKPSQKASFQKEESEFTVTDEVDVDLYVAWTYGWLKYDKESLLSVLRKVERYYNVEIQLPANYPGDDLITGKLDLKESLDAVMVVLADASRFEFRINENKVFIEKKMEELRRR
ncbi:FecR family protein [Mariniphaga sp.]|uniref:FecR family protein n=1 Tax=Mariniphaga sp. TaxID=1954475 RepID=UPI0035649CD7